jgi:hypothetical protein
MLGMKKRNNIVMLGSKKRNATYLGMKGKPSFNIMSMPFQNGLIAPKSILEKK